MTGIDAQERRSSDRLALLHSLSGDLDDEEYESLKSYLIGALSATVGTEGWESCLQSALHLIEMDRERRRAPGVALDPDDRCP